VRGRRLVDTPHRHTMHSGRSSGSTAIRSPFNLINVHMGGWIPTVVEHTNSMSARKAGCAAYIKNTPVQPTLMIGCVL
jgi:hypothetical protein